MNKVEKLLKAKQDIQRAKQLNWETRRKLEAWKMRLQQEEEAEQAEIDRLRAEVNAQHK